MCARSLLAAVIAGLSLATVSAGTARDDNVTTANVDVLYEQINDRFARAIAAICQTAREVYVRRFACDMPERLTVRVQTGWSDGPVLFSNGRDALVLRVTGDLQLRGSFGENEVHYLYGLCRELGLIAWERSLGDVAWLTGTAREGWCHYAASVVLDEVVRRRGSRIWPTRGRAYRDGESRLQNQLDLTDAPPVVRAAGAWKRLAEILGRRRVAGVFRAWSAMPSNAPDPATTMADMSGFARWYERARPLLVRDPSREPEPMLAADDLTGHPIVLFYGDGKADGQRRMRGNGCVMCFDAPAGAWYLRSVRVYIRRDGRSRLKRDAITLRLCDDAMHCLGEFRQSSHQLGRGAARWHRIGTPPIRVPRRFRVCVQVDDAALPDVTIYTDGSTRGHSFLARPGAEPVPLTTGDWMIRLRLDRPRAHDPLRPDVAPPSLIEQHGQSKNQPQRMAENVAPTPLTNRP